MHQGRLLCLDQASDEVCLYLLQLPGLKFDDEPFRRVLDPNENEQCARFARVEDRRRSTVARALLRCVISEYAGCRPREAPVQRDVNGRIRPVLLQDSSMLHVSLAAAGTFVAAAASRHVRVGVDVEPISNERFPSGLAAEFLSPREMAVFAGLTAAERTAWLSRTWVLKEAMLKQRGLGLMLPPCEVDVGLGAEDSSEMQRVRWRRPAGLDGIHACDFRWYGASVGLAVSGERPTIKCSEKTIRSVVAACSAA